MGLLKPIRDYLDALVHPSAQHDPLTAARHRAFIAPRLIGSVVALAIFPVYIAMRGVPSLLEVLVFAWLVAPMLSAYYLSRTGQYESAHVLSSLALTGLVTAVAADTGGITSFAAIWLVIVPLEAALSASRRVVAVASTAALGAAGLLLLLDSQQLLPDPSVDGGLAALGIISAALYATGLALGAESLTRTSFWLLYAEEDRYRLLARNMTDVISRHGKNGAVLFLSPAAEKLFGVGLNELHGHGLFERVHVGDRPAYLTALADAAAHSEERSVEFRVRRDAGDDPAAPQFIWVEMRCRPLDGAAGETYLKREVVAVMRDITPRKLQEQGIEDARAETERAHAAKSKFLANMSHELRTPLNAIIGFSEVLTEQMFGEVNDKQMEYLLDIHSSGQHLLSLINDVLDLSKIEAGKMELDLSCFDLGLLLEHSATLVRERAQRHGLALELDVGEGLTEWVADARKVKQVAVNLLSNAVKFTPNGGRVCVRARQLNGVDGLSGTWAEVSVTDTGVGIAPEDQALVFEEFRQASGNVLRKAEGTGLGLALVKRFVELHGGTVSLESEPGQGSTFRFTLPQHEVKALQ